MFYLVYVSYTDFTLTYTELQEILRVSQLNNKKRNITGALLYCEKKFIQVLEGEESVVRELLAKIRQDKRHRNVGVLIEGETKERNFADWSMAYKNYSGEQLNKIVGFYDIEEYFKEHPITDSSHVSSVFLQIFFSKNFKQNQLS